VCAIQVADLDLEACKIFISQGKGSKDRYVLFGKSFATALRTHIANHPNNRWLFQTTRNGKFSMHEATSPCVRQASPRPEHGASGNESPWGRRTSSAAPCPSPSPC
jgi:integrase